MAAKIKKERATHRHTIERTDTKAEVIAASDLADGEIGQIVSKGHNHGNWCIRFRAHIVYLDHPGYDEASADYRIEPLGKGRAIKLMRPLV